MLVGLRVAWGEIRHTILPAHCNYGRKFVDIDALGLPCFKAPEKARQRRLLGKEVILIWQKWIVKDVERTVSRYYLPALHLLLYPYYSSTGIVVGAGQVGSILLHY